MSYRILIGKFYMENGAVIPYAVLEQGGKGGFSFETTWDEKGHRITSVTNFVFITFKEIAQINMLDYSKIVCVVTDSEVSLTKEKAIAYWPELGGK